MALKFGLFGDPLKQAERLAQEGKRAEAAKLYAKAGDFRQAARLAAEARDEPAAVLYTLKAVFGEPPEGYADASAQQAGEILAKAGHHKEAVSLFELAQTYRQAAESCLKLQQPGRAARYYERGKAWAEAALYYQRAGMPQDALRALEQESNRLKQVLKSRRDPAAEEGLRRVEMQRAEILSRQGKSGEAAALVRGSGPATPKAARMLEAAGNLREAIEAYLSTGEPEQALRLLPRIPDVDRRFAAQVYLRCGKAIEAANLFATLGQGREAAEAYEQAGDWARAGARWEAAGEPLRAAQAFLRAERLQDAGRCFAGAGEMRLAAGAYAKAGDHRAAAACFQKAGQPVQAASHLLQAGAKAEAAKLLRQVPPGGPEPEKTALLLVPLLVEEGAHEEALARLRALPGEPGTGPDAAERIYWEGRALEALGKGNEAETCYRKVRGLKRGDHRDIAQRIRELAQGRPAPAPPGATEVPTLVQGPRPATPGVPAGAWPAGFLLAGRYEIQGELGRGGMGRVYRAYDREVREVVAIKTLLSQPKEGGAYEERLLREVQICRKITHPNVVRVFDLGRFAGGIFITMELIEGRRLDTLIHRDRPLPLAEVKSIVGQIAAGLKEAHALQVVHRDLKPGNVILTPTRLKILDFGIARMAGDAKLTQTGFAVGSPMYMSPEQLQGQTLDGRSDLYSLGVLAYALIAGREPFTGETLTVIAINHLQTQPPDIRRFRPDLPPAWPPFLAKLLAKRPAERYQSAQAVLDALAALPE